MANFVLDKGFLATGTNAYASGTAVVLQANGKSVAPAGANATGVVMVCQEDIDAVKVATGKAVINCRMMGIARVQLGTGGAAVGAKLATDANAKFVAATGTTSSWVATALSAGVAGDFIDAIVTCPGNWAGIGT